MPVDYPPLEPLKARDEQDLIHPPKPGPPRQGSIQIVIATDLPLNTNELKEVAKRAMLGVGNLGSTVNTSQRRFRHRPVHSQPHPHGCRTQSFLRESFTQTP